MPSPATESLMNIAKNSELRVYERIKRIKGADKKISSAAEANAIISIPSSDIIFTDNKDELSIAKMEAYNYIKGGGKNLLDGFTSLYNYFKDKGNVILARISDYFDSGYTYAQGK